ncbi:MAG TPA: hypothetical protein VFJ51_02460 [Nitrososphaeraceae archaeon]|jgi:hypothetical protein|nr:hypothetical protein [Nitrososphaeraceae archaeon]
MYHRVNWTVGANDITIQDGSTTLSTSIPFTFTGSDVNSIVGFHHHPLGVHQVLYPSPENNRHNIIRVST